MKITQKILDDLYQLDTDVKKQLDVASELLRIAQDRHGTEKVKVTRDGQEVEITENTLWEEVFHLGHQHSSAKPLKERHPEVFEAYTKQGKLADDLRNYIMKHFDADYRALTFADTIRVADAVVTSKLHHYGLIKK